MTHLTNDYTVDGLQKLCIERGDMLIKANAQILKLRKALEFYQNPSDYVAPFTGGLGKLYFDCGSTAKEALTSEYSGKE